MRYLHATALLAALALAACAPRVSVKAPESSDLAAEVVQGSPDNPPPAPEGICWAHDTIPAIYETVTEQTLVTEEIRDEAGNVITPAAYKTVSRVRQEQDRRDLWIKTPCEADLTVEFIATLQRALKARGYYTQALTGMMDDPTREAVRRYQAERGLDSPVLSLTATRQLGLVTTALEELK